jgi:hypothetical protein
MQHDRGRSPLIVSESFTLEPGNGGVRIYKGHLMLDRQAAHKGKADQGKINALSVTRVVDR